MNLHLSQYALEAADTGFGQTGYTWLYKIEAPFKRGIFFTSFKSNSEASI